MAIFLPKDDEVCPDFTECITNSIPNSVLLSTDDSKASKKKGPNARKMAKIIGCSDGYFQARRNSDEVRISCKCNSEAGCFWEPSVNNFHCIPVGQCRNMRTLSWNDISEESTRYRLSDNNPIAIPLSTSSADSKMLVIKFPLKINFELVRFTVWNGIVKKTFCDKGLTLLELEIYEPNILLQIDYDKSKYKAKDFNDLKYASFDEYDSHLGNCAFSLMHY